MAAESSIWSFSAGVLFRLTVIVCCLSAWKSSTVLAQDSPSRKNDCSAVDNPPPLKAIKLMSGAYSDEAVQKKVEETVIVCVTVDAHGKVTNVSPVSGPPELIQRTIEDAKKWEFEPPASAPVATKVETTYSLSGTCPDGSSDAGEIKIDIRPDLEAGRTDVLKLLGSDFRPLPEYPRNSQVAKTARAAYLSLVVNPDGTVSDVKIVKSLHELLDRLALEKVRTWRFNVSLRGKATRFFLTLSYRIPCYDRM